MERDITNETRQNALTTCTHEAEARLISEAGKIRIKYYQNDLDKYLRGDYPYSPNTVYFFMSSHKRAIKDCFSEAFAKGFEGREPELTVEALRRHIALGKIAAHETIDAQFGGKALPEVLDWLKSAYDAFAKRMEGAIITPPGRGRGR